MLGYLWKMYFQKIVQHIYGQFGSERGVLHWVLLAGVCWDLQGSTTQLGMGDQSLASITVISEKNH